MGTRIKVGGLVDLHEARYCSAMLVDLVGFNMESPKLNVKTLKGIKEWLSGPEIIAEYDSYELFQQEESDLVEICDFISFPFSEHKKLVNCSFPKIIIRLTSENNPKELILNWPDKSLFLEWVEPVFTEKIPSEVINTSIISFNDSKLAEAFNNSYPELWGINVGKDNFEGPGILDYEASDAFLYHLRPQD